MTDSAQESHPQPFPQLGPEKVLNLVETHLGRNCTNLCRVLNSYINRVFELEDEDGTGLVVKFYRPGRWSRQGLQDEHDFLLELHREEIPVVPPLQLTSGETLGSEGDLFFAIFPRCGGRSFDEFNEEQWLEIGRLLGRCHAVGATHPSRERLRMAPDSSSREHVRFILESGLIAKTQTATRFSTLCDELFAEIGPLFAETRMSRIHGDCHFSNIIHRPGESFFIIDFDDMVMGPAVQDLWMLLPDTPERSLLEIEFLLEGYETFHHFDRRSFRLIESLRAMRFLHYIAWLTFQYLADGSAPIVPGFSTPEYWDTEIADLADQLERIRKDDGEVGNFLLF
ncbi:MAG: serine/threonine protein kinase [Thermodesulfobacteriota bacterium]